MSEFMEADFSNSYTFFTVFILVFEEHVGSSWKLKADFDDSFKFLSCVAGLLGLQEARAKTNFWLLDPKIRPKFAQQLLKMESKSEPILEQLFYLFWGQFWVHFRGHFGVRMGQEAPTWAQEGPQEAQSTEKQQLQKVWFYHGENILFESWGLSRRA